MSGYAVLDQSLTERTMLNIDTPRCVCAGPSRLVKVIVNAPGEVTVFDAVRPEDARMCNLIYFDSVQGVGDAVERECGHGIYVVPRLGAVVVAHYWSLL